MSNVPCAEPLPTRADATLCRVLERVLATCDRFLPSIPSTLFSSSSLVHLYKHDDLVFSSREPAVNVYTAGGEFIAHKDHQALTVLLSLSRPEDYDGGGTGFWAQDARGHRVEGPSAILRPPAGDALLFGGHVTHCGMPVLGGTRCVLVASFSARGAPDRRSAEVDAQARDVYGDLV